MCFLGLTDIIPGSIRVHLLARPGQQGTLGARPGVRGQGWLQPLIPHMKVDWASFGHPSVRKPHSITMQTAAKSERGREGGRERRDG